MIIESDGLLHPSNQASANYSIRLINNEVETFLFNLLGHPTNLRLSIGVFGGPIPRNVTRTVTIEYDDINFVCQIPAISLASIDTNVDFVTDAILRHRCELGLNAQIENGEFSIA